MRLSEFPSFPTAYDVHCVEEQLWTRYAIGDPDFERGLYHKSPARSIALMYQIQEWVLFVAFWVTCVEYIRDCFNSLVCYFKGHRLQDCSYAGPDSGNMDLYCSRCHRYWDIPLY